MRTTTARVPAKINLALGVGPRRDDGYHPLATVYQAVDLCDEVRATEVDDDAVTVRVQFGGDGWREQAPVPTDANNLAVKAALALRDAFEVKAGAALSIRKVIPVMGGMAGGSADAAASLVACDALWGTGATRTQLEEIAAGLGSDVPFLLHGGTALGGGRGEEVSPVLARGRFHWVFAIADHGLSTAEVYAGYDLLHSDVPPPVPEVPAALLTALACGDAYGVGAALSNDLQAVALDLRPELRHIFTVGERGAALGTLVSGSGPTVMLLAEDADHSAQLAQMLLSEGVCADAVQASGPEPGAHLV
ncbi:4-(cytidine 5'-diphospho)-2-C-methyl-D-erythritol kinase [Mumia zhuanghuii]|uniref:4-diphosphocytidyl-2-C-methyl-D-erythritol kinase n=1 Tax=Mumia zhuanghuii TaxID=2585211 RepID=A0A5C4ML60_9ACTN|nr:4-(cytidine 5'-diphospho)-2-C-methyl-D-erythritol kinase [Mumia zhuanghuii]TNC37220.1 4-(cytidine 5'-diphospho)-2-C-methyl-D-erythritol kinase [Mumia zhuanghuii]TNC43109.1 4-(cytidine 5'-diphospho)-2-C-methyl-D-erythritol kinase [Mumia zhuanghuii]